MTCLTYGVDDMAHAPLRYAPPLQTTPTVVNVPATFYGGTFADDQDVILVMPPVQRTSTMTVQGGRNVRMIGGSIKKTQSAAAVNIGGVTRSIFIEGIEIDNSLAPGDAINACGKASSDPDGGATYPDVFLQNIRSVGVNGSSAGTHSDIFQPQGPIGRLFVDKLTGTSNYQGLFLDQDYPITEAFLSRVNLAYTIVAGDPVTYLLWHYTPGSTLPYQLSLSQVYIAPRTGQTVAAGGMYPSGTGVATQAVSTDGGLTSYWPMLNSAHGSVITGTPACGDFVPLGFAGLSYVSPGYLSHV